MTRDTQETPHRHRVLRAGIAGLALGALILPAAVAAEVVLRSGNNVTLGDTERVEGNFYALGQVVSTSAELSGDAYAAAGSVVVNGKIAKDLSVLGGTVQVHAPVGDDVRVVGGQVVIAGAVGGDVVVFGGELTILSTAEVKGDVLFYGGSLDVGGSVGGSLVATGERVRVNGAVGGDVMVRTHGTLALGSRAAVGGNVHYESPFELTRALEAVVEGEVRRTDIATAAENGFSVVPLLVLVFSAFTFRFVLGRRVDGQVAYTLRSFGAYGLIGFGALLLAPLVAGLLFISVIGSIIGLIVVSSYLLFLATSVALAPVAVGAQLGMLAKRGNPFGIGWTFLGALALFVLTLVPFVGWLLFVAVVLIVFGGLLSRCYRALR